MGGRAARRVRADLGAAVREFVREPVNLALLVALPPIVVVSYGTMMAAFPPMPGMAASAETAGAINGAMYVAAFLPGVIGLFQVVSARRADDRLALVGFARPVLFVARFGAVLLASALTALVVTAVLATRVGIEAPVLAGLTLLGVGAIYGAVGMIVGAALPRELEGSLVLVFLADVDEALASGLFRTDSPVARAFPLHYPHDVFLAAVTDGTVPADDAVLAATYGVALLAVAFLVYASLTGRGGTR